MPRYSGKAVLREKLKYAIHFCKSIDTDDYARVNLPSGEGDHSTNSSGELSDAGDSDQVGLHLLLWSTLPIPPLRNIKWTMSAWAATEL